MSWEQRNHDFSAAQTDVQMAYIEAERENRDLCDEVNWLHAELQAWEDEGVKLPLDEDGVVIRVGDKLDGYGKTITVTSMRHESLGWVLISDEGNDFHDCAAFTHHHAPTVEDVLRDVVTLCSNTWNGDVVRFSHYSVDEMMESGNMRDFAARLREVMSND